MNGSNIQNHSLMLSEYLHNIQYIDITIPSNSIAGFLGILLRHLLWYYKYPPQAAGFLGILLHRLLRL